jgi:hypothetical protein
MNVTDVKERYAISGVASRPAPRRNRIHAEIGQAVDILETGSPEEAEREGLQRLKGLYPERDGWEDHSVVVMVIEAIEASASRGRRHHEHQERPTTHDCRQGTRHTHPADLPL